jgi:hypothetical protein
VISTRTADLVTAGALAFGAALLYLGHRLNRKAQRA